MVLSHTTGLLINGDPIFVTEHNSPSPFQPKPTPKFPGEDSNNKFRINHANEDIG